MKDSRIAILGAGMSGMAASKALTGLNCVVYESRSHAGGHASSFRTENGFIFDEGPHVSFTPHERIKNFLARSVGDRFFEYPTYATNYFEGHILKHPVQCNLYGLPTDLITRCIADFVRAQYEDKRPVETYKDWCYRGFGATVSEVFTRPYTRKYWNLELEQLATDWVSERIYAPRLEEVLAGALDKQTGEHYYMSKFRYPEEGGFGAYNTLLERDAPTEFGMKAVQIDEVAKKITFANGKTEHYDHLISTVPLPELIKLCSHAPPSARDAAGKLACTSHFLLSVGINRPHVSDAYWTYYYDEDIPFSRASFPSKYSHKTAQPDCSSIQVEVVHSRYKSIPSHDVLVEQCIDSMLKVGLLQSRDEIVALDARDIRYANVIFDFERVRNRDIIHNYMSSHGIHWCGRYGEWAYLWTDQSILSGERAANEVRTTLGLAEATFDQTISSHAI
jgi:protoporphyrinogen oxidase